MHSFYSRERMTIKQRTTRVGAVAATVIGALLTATASATASASATAAGATPEWSMAHGEADASGLIVSHEGRNAIQGELRSAGTECYSLVIQPMLGSFPGPATKLGTQCGSGTTPVHREYSGSPLAKICRGDTAPFTDCGSAQRLPAGSAAPQGYVYEAAWPATPGSKVSCESQGRRGISEGRWTAYMCREEYRGGTDIPLLFQVLYVKK